MPRKKITINREDALQRLYSLVPAGVESDNHTIQELFADHLDKTQVAFVLGCSSRTVERLADQSKLVRTSLGTGVNAIVRYPFFSVEEVIYEESEVEPQPS